MKQFKLILSLVLACMPAVGFAKGESESGIKLLQVNVYDNIAVLTMIQAPQNSPACGEDDPRFAIDLSTEGGRAAYSTLLAAQSQGKPVYVKGTDACGLVSYLEDLAFVRFE